MALWYVLIEATRQVPVIPYCVEISKPFFFFRKERPVAREFLMFFCAVLSCQEILKYIIKKKKNTLAVYFPQQW